MSYEFNMNWAEPREARNWIRSQRKKMPWYIMTGGFITVTVIFQLMIISEHNWSYHYLIEDLHFSALVGLVATLMIYLVVWFEERVSNIKLTDKFISRYNKPYYRYNGDHDEREFSEFESFTIQPIFVRDKQYRILALMGYLDTEYFGLAEDTDEKAIREVLGRSLRYRNAVPEEQLDAAG